MCGEGSHLKPQIAVITKDLHSKDGSGFLHGAERKRGCSVRFDSNHSLLPITVIF